MAFQLPLPEPLRRAQWKVKIRDKERAEPPHVSIMHKHRTWRFDLRSRRFLDKEPPPSDCSAEVLKAILAALPTLVAAWDDMYPHNPVGGTA